MDGYDFLYIYLSHSAFGCLTKDDTVDATAELNLVALLANPYLTNLRSYKLTIYISDFLHHIKCPTTSAH
jgi:hypothetical protein